MSYVYIKIRQSTLSMLLMMMISSYSFNAFIFWEIKISFNSLFSFNSASGETWQWHSRISVCSVSRIHPVGRGCPLFNWWPNEEIGNKFPTRICHQEDSSSRPTTQLIFSSRWGPTHTHSRTQTERHRSKGLFFFKSPDVPGAWLCSWVARVSSLTKRI